MSLGVTKPNFEEFLKPIMNELKVLEYGISIDVNSNENKFIQFHLIAAVFDKPAKSSVLNLVSHNGFSSCLKCLQSGETQSTKDGKIHILYLKTLKSMYYHKNSDRWSQAYFSVSN